MYEVVIKIQGETEYKKFTIDEIEDLDGILENLKTEEVKLRRIDNVRIMGEEKTKGGRRLSL